MPHPEVELTLPANVDNIRVIRASVAAVAAAHDLTYEDVDDLRIAVDEACGLLLASAAAETFRVAMELHEASFDVLVSAAGAAEDIPRDGLAWAVMDGLADAVEVGDAGDGTCWIRLTKRLRSG